MALELKDIDDGWCIGLVPGGVFCVDVVRRWGKWTVMRVDVQSHTPDRMWSYGRGWPALAAALEAAIAWDGGNGSEPLRYQHRKLPRSSGDLC